MLFKNEKMLSCFIILISLLFLTACDENISGQITLNGQPLEGITVSLTGENKSGSVLTQADGTFSIPVNNGIYVIEASGQGLEIVPGPYQITINDELSEENNFSAQLISYEESTDVLGKAYLFGLSQDTISNAEISILEFPGRITKTNSMGEFVFEGLPIGYEATFVFNKQFFPENTTKTFILPEEDLEEVFFQAPNEFVYDMLRLAAGGKDNNCHLVTTVTSVYASSVWAGGLKGVQVTALKVDPDNPYTDEGIELGPKSKYGPVYFSSDKLSSEEIGYIPWPDKEMTETDGDGGLLFKNVPAGTYRLEGERDGYEFEPIILKCCDCKRVANAAPVNNLQGKRIY